MSITSRSKGKSTKKADTASDKLKEQEVQNNLITNETVSHDAELEEKYLIDPDTNTIDGVKVAHPNRNPDKHLERATTRAEKSKLAATVKTGSSRPGKSKTNSHVEFEELELNKESLQTLASHESDVCISLVVPVSRTEVEGSRLNQNNFKAAVQQLAGKLRAEVDEERNNKLTSPLHALVQDDEFWQMQSGGIAFFISDDHYKYVRLPSTPVQNVFVNHAFHLQALSLDLATPEHFFLLVLSKKQAKLFRADNNAMRFVDIPEIPNGIDDVVHLEEKDDKKLFRSGSSGAGGGAVYHGVGDGAPDEKANIAMYLTEVDNTIMQEVLHNEHAPLVLAGVDYIVSIYKNTSKYKHIWKESITGSVEYENEQKLFSEARKLTDEYFHQRSDKALKAFANQSATSLTTDSLDEIIPAAHYSRIAQLFVSDSEHVWGTFDKDSNEVTVHDSAERGDEDLLERAVTDTVLHGGDVHFLPKEKMPGSNAVAALLRFEA